LDVEGAAAAKRYYEKAGVKFHALVDPNYATGFGYVPFTFFINEYGVVQETRGWEARIKPKDDLRPVTAAIRAKWTAPGVRLRDAAVATLVAKQKNSPKDLAVATELASRYLGLEKAAEARELLATAIGAYDAQEVGRSGDKDQARLLGQAYLQMARACVDDRETAVKYATLAYYLNPSVSFGKQIARVIAPEKFDTASGKFDNAFREGTLRRLKEERKEWLGGE